MGREVRKVPADWVHPKYDENHPEVVKEGRTYLIGRYIPKLDSDYESAVNNWETYDLPEWEVGKALWDEGFIMTYADSYADGKTKVAISDYLEKRRKKQEAWNPTPENPDYEWWAGQRPEKPDPEHYMPKWNEDEATHYMMYENTSEGSPISPAFDTPEKLARWLADTGASAFADYTATYDEWLSTIRRGFAVSAVIDGNGIHSGVEAQA